MGARLEAISVSKKRLGGGCNYFLVDWIGFSMPIRIQCQCGHSLQVPDQLAGKSGKCPKCSNVIKIPFRREVQASRLHRKGPLQRLPPPNLGRLESRLGFGAQADGKSVSQTGCAGRQSGARRPLRSGWIGQENRDVLSRL